MLNALSDAALTASGFAWEAAAHGAESADDIEELPEEPTDAMADAVGFRPADEMAAEGEGEGEEDGAGEGAAREGRLLPLLAPSVDATSWAEEAARVAPQLQLQLSWAQGHWRHRLAVAQQHAPRTADGARADTRA